MTKVTTAKTFPGKSDLVIRFFFEDTDAFAAARRDLHRWLGEVIIPDSPLPFAGKERQTLLLFPRKLPAKRLLLVGCGKREGFSPERIRRAFAVAAKAARESRVDDVVISGTEQFAAHDLQPAHGETSGEITGRCATEGILLGLYSFDRYWTARERKIPNPSRFYLVVKGDAIRRECARGIEYGSIVSAGTIFARDLENMPAMDMYPEALAAAARKAGKETGFRVKVLGAREIDRLGMGGLTGVARGSHRPPRFLVMVYRPPRAAKRPVVLVGKGVTFDSGGISIKPAPNMGEMKADMSGAAAVIGTMRCAAALKLPVHVVGLVPATENMPGGSALKPGDILRHLNGMTSEVDNTDAEGRLILADALAYAARFNPSVTIDVATLTGAVVVALGHHATGMIGTDPATMSALKESGLRTHERVWELPLFDEYESLIKSEVADVKNTGGRWGGAITGAMFLKKFTGGRPWIHLDIAGTAIMEDSTEYISKGGSGVGVRLLTDFLRNRMGSIT
jgi:leucyl aminopeptidase